MGRSFETSDAHAQFHLKPLRVATRADGVHEEARNMVEDLPHWTVVAADDAQRRLTCRRDGGLLSAASTVTITCAGPADLPSTTVHVRSESTGAGLSRDRANVLEFMIPFHRRVC
jgi:hypothetical protein